MFHKTTAGVFNYGSALTLAVYFFLTPVAHADLATCDYQSPNDFLSYEVVTTTTSNILAASWLPANADTDGFIPLSTSAQDAATDADQIEALTDWFSILVDSNDDDANRGLGGSSEFTLGEAGVTLADMESDASASRTSRLTASVSRSIELAQALVGLAQATELPEWFTLRSVRLEKTELDRQGFDSLSDASPYQIAAYETASNPIAAQEIASPSVMAVDAKLNPQTNRRVATADQSANDAQAAASNEDANQPAADLASLASPVPEPSALSVLVLLAPVSLVRYRRVV